MTKTTLNGEAGYANAVSLIHKDIEQFRNPELTSEGEIRCLGTNPEIGNHKTGTKTDVERLEELKTNDLFPEIADGTYWYPIQCVGQGEQDANRSIRYSYMIGYIKTANRGIVGKLLEGWFQAYPPVGTVDISTSLYMTYYAVGVYNVKAVTLDVLPVFTLDKASSNLEVIKNSN